MEVDLKWSSAVIWKRCQFFIRIVLFYHIPLLWLVVPGISSRPCSVAGIAVHPHEDILSIHRFFSNGVPWFVISTSFRHWLFISRIRPETDLLKCTTVIFVRSFLIPSSLAFDGICIYTCTYYAIFKCSLVNLVPISATQPWQNQGSATRWLLSAFGSRPWFSQTTPQGVATRMQWMRGATEVGMLLITALVKNQVISRFTRCSSWYSRRIAGSCS